MASKVAEFVHLRGKVDDEKIAEMADVKLETVRAYWRKLDVQELELGDEAEAEEAPAEEDPSEELQVDEEPEPEPEAESEPEPEPPAAPVRVRRPPSTVRVVRRAIVRGPDGRTWRLSLRDVYRADRAAWLWEHHREHVEPFPPRKE